MHEFDLVGDSIHSSVVLGATHLRLAHVDRHDPTDARVQSERDSVRPAAREGIEYRQ